MKLPGGEAADARMARSGGLHDYLPEILIYPFRGFGAPVLLMITVFISLCLKWDGYELGIRLTSIPLLAITATWSMHYITLVIRDSARGHALPPALSGEVVFLSGGLKPLLLPAAMASLCFSMRATHPQPAQLLGLIFVILLPAYLFVLATEQSLGAAANPLRWLAVMAKMGLPYFVVVGLLAAGMSWLSMISGTTGIALMTALCCYIAVGSAHVLGFVGYKQHGQLGLHVEVRHPDQVAREDEQLRRMDSLMARVQLYLQNNDEEAAARAILDEPGGPVSVRAFFEQLFQRLLARGTVGIQHVAGRRLITVLLAENRAERALEIAEQCINRNMHFEPQLPAQLEVLARQALSQRYYPLFEKLLRKLDERYPGDPIIVTGQLLRAQYLAEHCNDEAGALALLQPLMAQTSHPQHSRVAAYARALTRLTGAR